MKCLHKITQAKIFLLSFHTVLFIIIHKIININLLKKFYDTVQDLFLENINFILFLTKTLSIPQNTTLHKLLSTSTFSQPSFSPSRHCTFTPQDPKYFNYSVTIINRLRIRFLFYVYMYMCIYISIHFHAQIIFISSKMS